MSQGSDRSCEVVVETGGAGVYFVGETRIVRGLPVRCTESYKKSDYPAKLAGRSEARSLRRGQTSWRYKGGD